MFFAYLSRMFFFKRRNKLNLIIQKLNSIMAQNDDLLAIAAELQESLTKIAADQATIIADIQAATTAGQPIPQSTIDALKTAADGIQASANAIDAAINPPAAQTS